MKCSMPHTFISSTIMQEVPAVLLLVYVICPEEPEEEVAFFSK